MMILLSIASVFILVFQTSQSLRISKGPTKVCSIGLVQKGRYDYELKNIKDGVFDAIEGIKSLPDTATDVVKSIQDLPVAVANSTAEALDLPRKLTISIKRGFRAPFVAVSNILSESKKVINKFYDYQDKIEESKELEIKIKAAKLEAAGRRRQKNPIKSAMETYENTKEKVYATIDDVNNAIITSKAIAVSVGTTVSNTVSAVQRLPITVEEVKTNTITQINDVKEDIEKKKKAAADLATTIWRVVTLEDARAFVKSTKENIDSFNARLKSDKNQQIDASKSPGKWKSSKIKTQAQKASPIEQIKSISQNIQNGVDSLSKTASAVAKTTNSAAELIGKVAESSKGVFNIAASTATSVSKARGEKEVKPVPPNAPSKMKKATSSPTKVISKSEANDKLFGFLNDEELQSTSAVLIDYATANQLIIDQSNVLDPIETSSPLISTDVVASGDKRSYDALVSADLSNGDRERGNENNIIINDSDKDGGISSSQHTNGVGSSISENIENDSGNSDSNSGSSDSNSGSSDSYSGSSYGYSGSFDSDSGSSSSDSGSSDSDSGGGDSD